MKKLDTLVKRVEQFERLAVYGDRKSFLKRLAQNMSVEPNQSKMPPAEPNQSVDPNSPVQTVKETVITGNPPIDKKVQKMLNELLAFQQHAEIMPLREDGELGPETRKALAKFKAKYNKPASVAAITEEFNKSKNPSAVATSPGAPIAPGKSNFPTGNTKATADSSAGKMTDVPGPKA